MHVRNAGLVNGAFGLASSGSNLLLVPLLLSLYGLEVYGVLCLLLAFAQYFTVLDLGFGNALVKYHVRAVTHRDPAYYRYRDLVVRLLIAVGAVAVACAALTAPLWGLAFGLGGVDDLALGAAAAGVLTITALVGNCYNSALVATLRYTQLGVFNLARNLGPQLVAAACYWWTSDLAGSLLAAALFAVLLLVGHAGWLTRDDPRLPGPAARLAWKDVAGFVRESASFSLLSVFNALGLPVLQSVTGLRFGPEANAVVEVARRALFAFRTLIHAAFVPLFARANQLLQLGELDELRRLLVMATAACSLLALLFYLGLEISLRPILGVWIGDAATRVLPVAQGLLLAVAFSIPHIAVYNVISTVGGGRRANALAAAVGLVFTATAVLPWATQLSDVLHAYAAGVLLGGIITLGYGAHFLRSLADASALAAAKPMEITRQHG